VPRGKVLAIGVGGGVVVLVVAIILVVTLVIQPNQRATQAAASASVQAYQEHQDAVAAFNSASHACTTANSSLSTAISSAQQAAKTDPSTMQDPTLIDKVNQAVATAQGVKNCTPPAMADDTDAIKQQTTQMATDTQALTSATSTLSSASSAVTASVSAKQQAVAQAQASAAAAVQTGSADLSTQDGYTYHLSWSGFSVTSSIDASQGAPGMVRMTYALSDGSVQVTNTTPGKVAPYLSLAFMPVYSADDISLWQALGVDPSQSAAWISGGASLSTIPPIHGYGTEPALYYFTNATDSTTPFQVGQTIDFELQLGAPAKTFAVDIPAASQGPVLAQANSPAGWIVSDNAEHSGTSLVSATCDAAGHCYADVSDSLAD